MKGASRAIAKECERLLCGDMRRIFLGGRKDSTSVTRSMGSINGCKTNGSSHGGSNNNIHLYNNDVYERNNNLEADENYLQYIEVWDYLGSTSFRGFVDERELPRSKQTERTLFLFFDQIQNTPLKHGLMALIELATECFNCDWLVICLERNAAGLQGLVRDLGWVGFELVTLAHWMQIESNNRRSSTSTRSDSFSSISTTSSIFSDDEVTSERWLFVGMEL